MRIQVNTKALAAYGMTLESLRSTIAAANANQAKGSFDGPTRAYAINGNDQLLDADDYANQVIAYQNGNAIRLRDVATIISGAENDKLGALLRRRRDQAGGGQARARHHPQHPSASPGANVITTVDKIKAELPELTAACRRASTSRWSPTAPPASALPSTTSSSSWCWPLCWWWR